MLSLYIRISPGFFLRQRAAFCAIHEMPPAAFPPPASKFYAALKNMMSLTIYNRHRTPEIPILRRFSETTAFIQMQGVLVFRLHTQGHFSLLICRYFYRFPQQLSSQPLSPEMVKAELGEPDSWANYLQT